MALPTIDVNYLGVLIAAVAAMVIGFLWYGPIFGKIWIREMKISEKDIKKAKQKGMTKNYVLNFIGALITAYVLAHFVGFLTLSTFSEAFQLAFWSWLGFFAAAALLGGVLWEGKSWKLFLINGSYWLVNLIIMAGILTAW